jgi:hypothetical protein
MSYLRTGLGASFTEEQQEALLDISPAELRSLPLERKVELAFQHFDTEARKREAFWNAVQGFASGMIPILAFLGVSQLGKK